jgi:hypothetical protein
LNDRLRFEKSWTVSEKIQWCKSVTDYIQCAGKHITNCSIIEVRDDVEQLSNFMEHIMKQANLYCHGKNNHFLSFKNILNDFKVVFMVANMLLLMYVVDKVHENFIVVKHLIQQQKL